MERCRNPTLHNSPLVLSLSCGRKGKASTFAIRPTTAACNWPGAVVGQNRLSAVPGFLLLGLDRDRLVFHHRLGCGNQPERAPSIWVPSSRRNSRAGFAHYPLRWRLVLAELDLPGHGYPRTGLQASRDFRNFVAKVECC